VIAGLLSIGFTAGINADRSGILVHHRRDSAIKLNQLRHKCALALARWILWL
jgi:hypothetical protein